MTDSTNPTAPTLPSPQDLRTQPGHAFSVDLSNCEREPIHIPGSIQPHGVLLVARQEDMRVVYASANAGMALRRPAASILGKPLAECLDRSAYEKLVHLDTSGEAPFQPFCSHHVEIAGAMWHFEVRHVNGLVYFEIELDSPDREAELLPSVTQQTVSAMRSATSMQALLSIAATELRRLTGYDRVMTYEFQEDGHGVVVAEDLAPGMLPYLGLHYPASDIPAQARRLYLVQRIRVIPEVAYAPVPMLADGSLADAYGQAPPLDMTFCHLRSVSPIHLEYLTNMGASSTLTLSLIVDDDLWGLMVCHHRTPRFPTPAIRSSCDLISQMTSFLIRARIELDAMAEAKLAGSRVDEIAAHLEQRSGICEALAVAESELLPLVGAAGALICFEGKSELVGRTPTLKESVQVMNRLHAVSGGKVYSHSALCELQPEFAPFQAAASGAMLMPILGSPENAILWFRPEVIETVHWGGNPDKSVEIDQTNGKISPRKSFAVWKTQVVGKSAPWRPRDTRAANELRKTISDHLLAKAEGLFSNFGLVDTLTLLPNRRRFQSELRLRGDGSENPEVAVILVNLDRFKQVNEAFGHAVGDHLLLQVTRRLAKLVTPDVLLARLGADEFALLCSGAMALKADEIAATINDSLASPFQLDGKPFRITASLGIAHGERELLRAADTAMHFAKRTGRNRLVAFNKLLHETAVKRLELQQDIYRALEAKEFKLVYQPIVSIEGAILHGFEALLRWHHPTRGVISPLDFIPLAEETGLIVPIGREVLKEAVRQTKRWTETFRHPLTIHVNVAAPQLVGTEFVADVKSILAECSLGPEALTIEVTESVLMRDAAVESLKALKALGVEVSIDDFGTGYSSLAYLQQLPVDIVKIDKSFINNIAQLDKSKDFLEAMLGLTQTLGLKPIAEGVETLAQRDVLSLLKCSMAQGYLFSKPLDSLMAEALMDAGSQTGWRVQHA